jgi:hypothetical protein
VRILRGLLLALLAGSANAAACTKPLATPQGLAKGSTYYNDAMPPQRFRGDGSAAVVFRSPAEVDRFCRRLSGQSPCGYRFEACAYGRHMMLPNPCDPSFAGQSFARTACHELGHISGWPATHGE